jgi:hypothetical protein
MPDSLTGAAEIKQPIVRGIAEFARFYVTGVDGLVTVGGVVALLVVYLPIPDATFAAVAQTFHTFAPGVFLAVALRAAYLTGAVEERRTRPVVFYTREHIDKMNEVAREVRLRIQWFGTSEYYSNTAPAGTADLVRALDSHFTDLQLAGWDAAARQLQEARAQIEDHVKSLGGQIGPNFHVFTEAAERGVAPQLEWSIQETPDAHYLYLMTWNLGRVTDVTSLSEAEILAIKETWQEDTANIAAWPEGRQVREMRQGMQQQRSMLLDRLREISQVDALPAGTRCQLCDPRP